MKLEFLLFFSSNIQKVTLDIVFTGTSAGENEWTTISQHQNWEKVLENRGCILFIIEHSISDITNGAQKTFDYLIELNFSVQTKTFILFAKRIKIILAFSLYPLWSTILTTINIFNSIVGLATLATFVLHFFLSLSLVKPPKMTLFI